MLRTEQSFDAAHFLKDYDGKCSNIHGHRWRVVVSIRAEKLSTEQQTKGMILDFSDLKKALKSICDYLIVGVNSDELMKSFKHKTPIIPEDERLEIIEAIRYVDEAHIVTNRDKLEALDKFHYQALIMGDDWKGTDFYKKVEQK